MKIVVAPDSFKGSLPASDAARSIARGVRAVLPQAEITSLPLADGGEGTAEAWRRAHGGRWIRQGVAGPLPGQTVEAGFLELSDGAALVEMAAASGLELVPSGRRDPLRTTTRGTGELLAAACRAGARTLWLAVGGSATVDGGTGAATAQGWRFLDRHGRELPPGGGSLVELEHLEAPAESRLTPLRVLCDVDNPLCGPEGAARVFAPQKGASPWAIERLEAGLERLAEVVLRELGTSIQDLPRGGAAGGLAAGAHAFFGGELVDGVEAVMEAVGLEKALIGADRVITGEGRLDAQSLRGKVVAGVARRAAALGVAMAVVAGVVELGEAELAELGVAEVEAALPRNMAEDEALQQAGALLEAAARRLAGRWR